MAQCIAPFYTTPCLSDAKQQRQMLSLNAAWTMPTFYCSPYLASLVVLLMVPVLLVIAVEVVLLRSTLHYSV